MEILFILFFWLPLCIAVAILANRYNRSAIRWFLFSVLLSPLLGFIFVLACGPKPEQIRERKQVLGLTLLFLAIGLGIVAMTSPSMSAPNELETCKAEVRTMWANTLDKLPEMLERHMQAQHEKRMRETTDLDERVWQQFRYELGKKIAEPFLSPEFWHAVVLPEIEKALDNLTYAEACVEFKAYQEKELRKFIEEIAKL